MFKKVLADQKGFTLLELLIAIAIIAVLAAMAIPALSNQGDEAKLTAHKANLVSISGAADRYQAKKGFVAADFKQIDSTHPLITDAYLREEPSNPWANTTAQQAGFVYVLAKNNTTGVLQAFLAGKISGVNKYVDKAGAVSDFPAGWTVVIP